MIGRAFNRLGAAMKIGAIAACVSATALPMPASADGLNLKAVSERNRQAQFDRQKQLMDSRLASQYQQSKRLRPTKSAGGECHHNGTFADDLDQGL